jgi:DNA (cytosine-5)-methyltransferase 1
MYDFYEFFAGGGMARLGLGPGWRCVFGNDIDERKARAYHDNFKGAPEWFSGDVAKVKISDLPGVADLAWASFPCQDLSLAGSGGGLNAERSGTFWPFWRLMQGLVREGRAPRLIVLENVYGALTSHGGADFMAIAKALVDSEYRLGALVIDAVNFVPQSRPRLFIVAIRKNMFVNYDLVYDAPHPLWHPPVVVARSEEVEAISPGSWLWWALPSPPPHTQIFADLLEETPKGVVWHSLAETKRLLSMMSEVNFAKVKNAQASKRLMVGAIYKRIRKGVQRAEIRFDGLAGCLRTPVGGSSRQIIMIVEGKRIRSRLLSPREAARLMGLPETYKLPEKYNDAYHLAGDGLVVPVVRHLAENVLEPALRRWKTQKGKAA